MPPMISACEECLRRPAGLEGHDGLHLAETSKMGPVFKCARCGSSWLRSYEGNGVFVWMEYAAVEGGTQLR